MRRNNVTMSIKERKYLQKKLKEDIAEFLYLIEYQSEKVDFETIQTWQYNKNFCESLLKKVDKRLIDIEN